MNWFCNVSGLNCIDLQQAISDVQLQLNVTLVFLGLLVAFIVVFGAVSKWLAARQKNKVKDTLPTPKQRPLNYKLKLRKKQGLYDQKQVVDQTPPLQPSPWWSDYWQGISTEFFGAVVTTILLGLGVLVFEQYQDIQNHKADLILQMGSPDNSFAIEAVRQLRAEGWLTDGTLTSANLFRANLTDAFLGDADLTNAYLRSADLTNAYLVRANLTTAYLRSADLTDAILIGANMINANLQDANLTGAELRDNDLTGAILGGANLTGAELRDNDLTGAILGGANLTGADLQGADLTNADLQVANMTNANLQGANMTNAVLFNATLPDGTTWTPSNDLTRFTDPEHPDFWDLCEEVTPAPWRCN